MTEHKELLALADRLSSPVGPHVISEFERADIVRALRRAAQRPEAAPVADVPPLNRETIQTLLDLLNPLHGEMDRQTYDQKRENFDAPDDAEFSVNVTARMDRDLTQAVLILENRKCDPQIATPPASQPPAEAGREELDYIQSVIIENAVRAEDIVFDTASQEQNGGILGIKAVAEQAGTSLRAVAERVAALRSGDVVRKALERQCDNMAFILNHGGEWPPRSSPPADAARPIAEYHEDMGTVLWWKFPVVEPPYVGSPLDCGREVEVTIESSMATRLGQAGKSSSFSFVRMVGGWPGYHTHFTKITMPEEPHA